MATRHFEVVLGGARKASFSVSCSVYIIQNMTIDFLTYAQNRRDNNMFALCLRFVVRLGPV
jgi:hypothetical protein